MFRLTNRTISIYRRGLTIFSCSAWYELDDLCFALSLKRFSNFCESGFYFPFCQGAFAFFRQCGFAMFKAGMVQEKNVVNTILKSILDAAIGGIVFWIFGYAFAFGGQEGNVKSFIGNTDVFARNDKQGYNHFSRFFFQLIFAQTAASIVSGALTERSKLSANFWASSFISAFVYPVIAHSAWSKSGFLSAYNDKPFRGVGAIDMGGSGVIHVTGGLIALIGAIIVGPRTGRFYDEEGKPLTTPRYIRNFCPSFLLLGVFVAWVGWYVNRGRLEVVFSFVAKMFVKDWLQSWRCGLYFKSTGCHRRRTFSRDHNSVSCSRRPVRSVVGHCY